MLGGGTYYDACRQREALDTMTFPELVRVASFTSGFPTNWLLSPIIDREWITRHIMTDFVRGAE